MPVSTVRDKQIQNTGRNHFKWLRNHIFALGFCQQAALLRLWQVLPFTYNCFWKHIGNVEQIPEQAICYTDSRMSNDNKCMCHF